MSLKLLDPKIEYDKDKNLKQEDIQAFLEWVNKQPHIPEINELQAIIFLQSCYYRNEAAKPVIDMYFTMKTLCPDIFLGRNPLNPTLEEHLNATLITPLPQKTPEGYTIFLITLLEPEPEKFTFPMQLKIFDMTFMRYLYQEGTSTGHLIVFDIKGAVLGHFGRLGPFTMQKFIYYLQDAMPIRLKGFHFINIVPVIDKVMVLMRAFMKKELYELFHLHKSVDGLLEIIPLECLPEDYGGKAPSVSILHEQTKSTLKENEALFNWEDKYLVDESKRPGKPKNVGEIFGVEGTFKKLELD